MSSKKGYREPAKKEKEDANHVFYYFLLVIAFY
jgi:hypothetical protein